MKLTNAYETRLLLEYLHVDQLWKYCITKEYLLVYLIFLGMINKSYSHVINLETTGRYVGVFVVSPRM